MRASQPRRATAIPFVGVLRVGTPSINSPRFNWVSTGFQLWGSTTGVQPHSKYSTTALTVRATSSSYNIELLHHGLDCGVKQWVYTSVATKLCCSGALLCGAVAVLCGAVLLCYCISPVLELQHELLQHWVDTFSCNPTVTTPSCYCGLLHCCAALLCCTVVLLCCAALLRSVRRPLRVTTPSCYTSGLVPSVVTEGIPLRDRRDLSHRSKTGHRPTTRIQSVARERVTVGF